MTVTKRAAVAAALSAVSALALQGLALPAAHAASPASSTAATVGGIEPAAARALAASLVDNGWRARVRTAALGSRQVDLAAIAARSAAPAGLGTALSGA